MKKTYLFTALFAALLTVPALQPAADVRTKNISLYLVVDKSKSMVEEMESVREFIVRNYVDGFLIPGDQLVLIEFYGESRLLFSGTIGGPPDLSRIRNLVRGLEPDGRYTDIGNALDFLRKTTEEFPPPSGSLSYLFLLTDGIQEAPPGSPYFSEDGSFNHLFLENTKTIRQKGWKIQILGIGSESAARRIARELTTTYSEYDGDLLLADTPDPGDLLGRITAADPVISGSELIITLSSDGYSGPREVLLEDICIQSGGKTVSVINGPVSLLVPPESTGSFSIPLSHSPENETGLLLFYFTGNTPFVPASFNLPAGDSPAYLKASEETGAQISGRDTGAGDAAADKEQPELPAASESTADVKNMSDKMENSSKKTIIIVTGLLLLSAAFILFRWFRRKMLDKDDTKKGNYEISDDN